MLETGSLICPWCGVSTPMDYVHGHAQCLNCKTNIAPCCDGAEICRPQSEGRRAGDDP